MKVKNNTLKTTLSLLFCLSLLLFSACGNEVAPDGDTSSSSSSSSATVLGKVYVSLTVDSTALNFVNVKTASADGTDLTPFLSTLGSGTTNLYPTILSNRYFPVAFNADLKDAGGSILSTTNVNTIIGDINNKTPYDLTNYNYIWKISVYVGFDSVALVPIIVYDVPTAPEQRVLGSPLKKNKKSRFSIGGGTATKPSYVRNEYVRITNQIPIIDLRKVSINGVEQTSQINQDYFTADCYGKKPRVNYTISYKGFWNNSSFSMTSAIGVVVIGGTTTDTNNQPLSDYYWDVVFKPYFDMNSMMGKAKVDVALTQVLVD